MSVSTEGPTGPASASGSGSAGTRLESERGLDVCPFLRSADGAWSSAHASRDLRCWAVHPATQPAVQKQRGLCVASAHGACATFLAARAADALYGHPDASDATLWPETSPTPVALEALHTRPGASVGSPPTGGQALLVGLMVVAFLVLVIARTNPLGGGDATVSLGPSGLADASPFVGPSAASSSGPAISAVVTPAPTASAPSTPAPSTLAPSSTPTASPQAAPTQRTYRVRSGDTIAAIAVKYQSTVKAIVKANNIVDPRLIHPGQVLIIP